MDQPSKGISPLSHPQSGVAAPLRQMDGANEPSAGGLRKPLQPDYGSGTSGGVDESRA